MKKGKLQDYQGLEPEDLVGKIVAVYQQEFVGLGDNETAMRIELSKKYRVHPGRFVLRRISKGAVQKVAVIGTGVVLFGWFAIFCILFVAAICAMGTKSNTTFSKIGSAVS